MFNMGVARIVEAHYAEPGLVERVRESLRESGMDPDALDQARIGNLDQLHAGGLEATDELAKAAEISSADLVLDLGSGAGGPSRRLAATIGCHVTGLDLTEEYVQVATMLARSTGLAHLLKYRQGDATATPFDADVFDVVWTQHASMNIEDKAGLVGEMYRVLKKGGRLALHDVVAGPGVMRYPVPWASRSDFSFLIAPDDLLELLKSTGFRNIVSQDVTEESTRSLHRVAQNAPVTGFGPRIFLGPDFPDMIMNFTANLESGACNVLRLTCTK